MSNKRLLLFSNSKNHGREYLGHTLETIRKFLGPDVHQVLFVPYAGIRISYDEYTATVTERFRRIGYSVTGIQTESDPVKPVMETDAIVMGGGNTFHLLYQLYQNNLLEPIRNRVMSGVPYIGWSAGSNVACPTMQTTNDMPIIEPPSLKALGLIPFQINPHYTEARPPGHQGETRANRLEEYVEVNPDMYVAGLYEGSALIIENDMIKLLGDKPVRVFKKGRPIMDYAPGTSLEFLL
jgi:dipeptidase E